MNFKKCVLCVEERMQEGMSLRKAWALLQCVINHYGSMSASMPYEEFTLDNDGEFDLQIIEDFSSIVDSPERYIVEGEGQEKKYNRGDFSVSGNTIIVDGPDVAGQRWSIRYL